MSILGIISLKLPQSSMEIWRESNNLPDGAPEDEPGLQVAVPPEHAKRVLHRLRAHPASATDPLVER